MFWTQIVWLQFNQAQQINEIYFKVITSGKLFSVLLAIKLFKVIENDANMIRRDSLMLKVHSHCRQDSLENSQNSPIFMYVVGFGEFWKFLSYSGPCFVEFLFDS